MRYSFLLLVVISCLIIPVNAIEIDLEQHDNSKILVVYSEKPLVISSFVVQLNYNQPYFIERVEEIHPFVTVANIQNSKGYTRIAASSGMSHVPSNKVSIAKIIANNDFVSEIIIEELYDENLNLIIGDIYLPNTNEINYPQLPGEKGFADLFDVPSIPQEKRVFWSLPTDSIIIGTTPVVEQTTLPTNEDMDGGADGAFTDRANQTPKSSTNQLEVPVDYSQEDNTMGSSEKAPISFLPIFVGMLIAILIIRKGL